jgi:hypothetical protein
MTYRAYPNATPRKILKIKKSKNGENKLSCVRSEKNGEI